jgi:hypothetical protein
MSDSLDLPVTRFGAVPFEVMWPDGGADAAMPDWSQEAYTLSRHVPGSDRTIVQTLGKGPLTVTYRLWLESVGDYRALQAKVQRIDVLVLFAGMTSAGSTYVGEVTYVDVRGEGYVFINAVNLFSLGQPSIFVDGTVEVDATFQRNTL